MRSDIKEKKRKEKKRNEKKRKEKKRREIIQKRRRVEIDLVLLISGLVSRAMGVQSKQEVGEIR